MPATRQALAERGLIDVEVLLSTDPLERRAALQDRARDEHVPNVALAEATGDGIEIVAEKIRTAIDKLDLPEEEAVKAKIELLTMALNRILPDREMNELIDEVKRLQDELAATRDNQNKKGGDRHGRH